jgi:glycosyltransferase involved in cell wall biosynthesis
MSKNPKVSIGLPVRNGGPLLAEAIDSILAQTFVDFELIISDNASTDDTPAICAAYAARDPRVRVFRQERNIGAAANFNLVFARSTGKYFKWAAHDDLIHPSYLEACLAVLEAQPDAVLCQSMVEIVDRNNGEREVFDHTAFGSAGPAPSERLVARLRARPCTDVFGLVRRETLRDTALMADHVGADRTLLIELALRGRFALVPEILFFNRDHPHRATRQLKSMRAQAAWYAPDQPTPKFLRTWMLYRTSLRLVRRHVTEPAERRRCYLALFKSLAHRHGWFRLAFEPLEAIHPRAHHIERWLFGTAVSLRLALRRHGIFTLRQARAGLPELRRPNQPL